MDSESRRQLEAQLSAYLDGELTEAQRSAVEAFLAEDADARELLEELKTTITALQGLDRAETSAQFASNLRARLERRALLGDKGPGRSSPPPLLSRMGRWTAAAAVLALAFVGAYVTWSVSHPKDAPPTQQFALREATDEADTDSLAEDFLAEADAPGMEPQDAPRQAPARIADERMALRARPTRDARDAMETMKAAAQPPEMAEAEKERPPVSPEWPDTHGPSDLEVVADAEPPVEPTPTSGPVSPKPSAFAQVMRSLTQAASTQPDEGPDGQPDPPLDELLDEPSDEQPDEDPLANRPVAIPAEPVEESPTDEPAQPTTQPAAQPATQPAMQPANTPLPAAEAAEPATRPSDD